MPQLTASELKPLIGAMPHLAREALLGGAWADALRELLVTRGVLLWRGLDISIDEQRAITAQFGPVRAEGGGEDGDGKGGGGALQRVTIDPDASAEYSAYYANTMLWHMDGYHDQTVPCFGGSFRPVTLAPEGGETEFLNAYAAYEALPDSERRLIDGLEVVYSAVTVGLAANPDADDAQVDGWRRRPRPMQPLVWEHRSGRRSLMLGAAVSHVVGMAPADSQDLLVRLRAHMGQERFVYRHEWRIGDLLVWNNTGTMHRARPFDPRCGRLLHRFTIEGDEPIRGCAQA
ncbi:MAG: TauD/TfdA family dioxygenase [Sphingomonadales bacterium]|nr:TauD/TfdA family dioxygenase [Sphingomonadales bacterium]